MQKDNPQRRSDQQAVETAFAGGGEPWNPQDYAGALPHAFDPSAIHRALFNQPESFWKQYVHRFGQA